MSTTSKEQDRTDSMVGKIENWDAKTVRGSGAPAQQLSPAARAAMPWTLPADEHRARIRAAIRTLRDE
jgi:hypothetical protein